MGLRSLTRFEKLILTLLALRFGALLFGAFLPLGFPDVWRQITTLGISMRYWSRWNLEPGAEHLLLPAVLDSGDGQGFMPMEFPILNLLTAPFFAMGPYWGRVGAILFFQVMTFSM